MSEAERGWQSIETIPTADESHRWHRGERVLVWVADAGDDRRGTCAFGYGYRHDDGSVGAHAEGYNGDWHITHWAPLLGQPATPIPSPNRRR